MILQTWAQVFTQSVQDIGAGIIEFVPNIFIALLIFLLGWVFGTVLGQIVSQLVKTLKVDNALRSAGLEDALSKAGFTLNSGGFLGGLIKWFVIIVFLVASLEVLGLNRVTVFLQEVVLLYLPNVIAAVLILLVAAVIAEVMQKIVIGGARAANIQSANFLGSVTRWSIWVFAILAALSQLNVATAFVQTLFTGIVIAISLALGLSFGLGGQDAARDYIKKLQVEVSHRK
jgi:small-conductance mechanosensitive channel